MARMNFQDFKQELIDRGFDGFSDESLGRYVNWGYKHIARKFPWYWQKTTDTFTVAPGTYKVALGTELPNFRSLDALFVTTADQRRKLEPMDELDFLKRWLPLDLTSSSYRGEPDKYYIYDEELYILTPPSASRDFIAYYHQWVPELSGSQTPLTPENLDEAIVLASLVRAHKRAMEPELAGMAKLELDEFLDDMRNDEELMSLEVQDRVRPDDTWL